MVNRWDDLWLNGTLATCESPNSIIHQGAIAVKEGKIAWLGKMSDLPGSPEALSIHVHDLQNRCLTPGLIDCHTHLVYAGNRALEFEKRLQGVTYEEIAREGGGIQSTVSSTRNASEEELFRESVKRARALMASGVTTLEIKSGYGLDLATEIKMLRVAKRIEETLNITVRKTFLGAHTIPGEYKGRSDEYIDFICDEVLPVVVKEKLADAMDVFCEKIAFTLPQAERIFKAAQQSGLGIKCHAEQLSDSGCAALAAKYHALSVDHLEYLSSEGVNAIARSQTVAVLLPGAFYFLREKKLPPIELLRKKQVPMAVASDCNPGTSPITSLLLILNMACTLFSFTPTEALLGVTQQAAKALGLARTHGTLTIGKVADFAIWDVSHPIELVYEMGGSPLWKCVKQKSWGGVNVGGA